MATLSAGDLTNLREKKHSSKFYLSVLQPTTLLTALVNDGTIARGDRAIIYDTGSGDYASITGGQTLWVGTTAGANDVGRVRVKSITGTATSGTITIDENGIDWGNNLHLTILHNYEIWPIPPRLDTGIFYKFYNTTYSDQNTKPNPVAIAGPHQAGFLSSGSLVLNVPVADSYAVASGATISTKVVSVSPAAGSSVGAEAGGVIPITYTTTGARWVKLVVTDSNGKTQDTYRCHFVYDTSSYPYMDFDVSGLTGDWNSGGWRYNVTVYGDQTQSDFPDGSLCLLWREGRIDDTESYVNIWSTGDNILCAGYIRDENVTDQLGPREGGIGSVSFSVETPNGVMSNRTEMGPVRLQTASTPAAWYEYATWMTCGRAIHHLLKWHSTVLETVDVYGLLDNTLGVNIVEYNEPNLLSRINSFAMGRGILGKLLSDRLGRLHLSEDTQMFNETNRDAEDTVFSITRQDLGGEVNISRRSEESAALSFLGGSSFDGTTETSLISIAGGYIDGAAKSWHVPEPAGADTVNVDVQILNDQTDGNEKCGRLLAAQNNKLKEIRIPLRGDYLGAFDIDPQLGWYTWGVANTVLKRQLSLNAIKFLCRRVEADIDVGQGTVYSSVILEAEAEGPDGIPGNYPTSYPTPALPEPNWTLPSTDCGGGTINTPLTVDTGTCGRGGVAITPITSTDYIAVWTEFGSTRLRGCVLQVSGTTVTNGTVIDIDTTSTPAEPSVSKLSTTAAICTYNYGLNAQPYAVVLTASGSTLSAGTPVQIETVGGTGTNGGTVCALTSSLAFAIYGQNSDFTTRGCPLAISGSTVTPGTPAQVSALSNGIHPQVVAIDASSALCVYTDTVSDEDLVGRVAHTITSSTFSLGTETVLVDEYGNMGQTPLNCIDMLDSTTFISVFHGDSGATLEGTLVHVGTISGTTITPGTTTQIDSDLNKTDTRQGFIALSTTDVLFAIWSNADTTQGELICGTVSGEAVTVGSSPGSYGTARSGGTPLQAQALAYLGATQALLIYADDGTENLIAVVVDVA